MTIEQRLDRIERLLRDTLKKESKQPETWVNGAWVTSITGWTKEQMRSARMQGIVKFQRSQTQTYKYLLESIPQQFIKQAQ
jgi:hypothetical protein